MRRVTPGGRCPICEPRTDGLAQLELDVTPAREARAALLLEDKRDELTRELAAISNELSDAEAMLSLADGAACLLDFRLFLTHAWHALDPSGRGYVVNPGTDAIAVHMQALADGVFALLGIAVSPGFGKTTVASVAYPAWMWARNPTWRAICASHAFELARDIAGRFHRFVTSDWYRTTFPYVEITGEALKSMSTSAGGVRYAVGVEGALTGLRADAGLIDDSLNAVDARTRHNVESVNMWYREAFSTRFDRRSSGLNTSRMGRHTVYDPTITVIQQRLAENDLINLVREQGGEVLELPARHETGRKCSTLIWSDPRTTEGELLAPEIHGDQYLQEREQAMGAHAFACQYQQRPGARDGDRFKIGSWAWCALTGDGSPHPTRPERARGGSALVLQRRRDGSLDLDHVVLSIDATQGSTSSTASALGIGLVGAKGTRRHVLADFTQGPASWTQTVQRVAGAIRASLELVGKQRRLIVLLEKKAMGGADEAPLPTQIREMIASGEFQWSTGERAVVKLELYEPVGRGSKESRADALEVVVDAGLVHLVDGAPWVPAFLSELTVFPNGARDDRVDWLGQAIDFLREVKTSWGKLA